MESENPGPLPTKEIARRHRKVEFSQLQGRLTVESLGSFTHEDTVTSDPHRTVEVGNIRFLNDNDMPDGESSILGKGAFATVRLARMIRPAQRNRRATNESEISCLSDHMETNEELFGSSMDSSSEKKYRSSMPSLRSYKSKDKGSLAAVKIFEKSLLEQCRTIERDSENQMQVRTALENVKLEIAVMKMIQHPNLVSLYEVIDTGSNRLYMVIEYVSLGEIMTNVKGTDMYKRRPTRKGEHKLQGVTPEGHFDEHHAALFFVDIMHGLSHLHKNRIAHRDLKPENILLDPSGHVKIGDFGVAHFFEDEMKSIERSSLGQHLSSNEEVDSSAELNRTESEYALGMRSMSDMGKLTKTEGTWCFWSPEMCAENSLIFSGYACDMYAAGVCLYIFATGKLPFYSEVPLVLFDIIADARIKVDELKLSDELKDVLGKLLTKDASGRVGIGDCLQHPFCKDARKQRIKKPEKELERPEVVHCHSENMIQAFSSTNQDSPKIPRHSKNPIRRLSKRMQSFIGSARKFSNV